MTGRLARQAPFLTVWVVVAIGFAFVAASYWRRGLVIVAAAAVLAGLLRLVLPARRAGWLVVRSRPLDVLCFAGLGAALGVLTVVVPAE
ncbi:hypothetical protein BH20ACT5_BH20ACT5_14960 [soil metagenome]